MVGLTLSALKKEILSVRPVKSSAIYDMAVYLANKPYNIAQIVIERLTKPGDIVLDPFLGSGVTLVEALRLKRKAIGVDINPYSIIISRASLQQCDTSKYTKLVDEVVGKTEHKINSLYLTKCDECGRIEGVICRAEYTNEKPDFVRHYCRFDQRMPHRKRGPNNPTLTLREPANKFDAQSVKLFETANYRTPQRLRR